MKRETGCSSRLTPPLCKYEPNSLRIIFHPTLCWICATKNSGCSEGAIKWADKSDRWVLVPVPPFQTGASTKSVPEFFFIVVWRHLTVNWVKSSRHTQRRWHYAECQEWQMWFKMSSPAFITPNAFFMNPPGSLSFLFFFLLTWLPLSYTFCIVCCCCSLTVMSFWLAGEQEPLHQPPLSSPQLGESVPFPALLEITELLNHSNIAARVTANISHWPPFKSL